MEQQTKFQISIAVGVVSFIIFLLVLKKRNRSCSIVASRLRAQGNIGVKDVKATVTESSSEVASNIRSEHANITIEGVTVEIK